MSPSERAGRARTWVLIEPDAAPPRWRERGSNVLLVPLLPEEAEGLAAGGEVREPLLDPLDEKIARLVVQGKSLAEVARATSVGERTVDRRIRRMRSRYGLDSRAAFLEFFSRLDP